MLSGVRYCNETDDCIVRFRVSHRLPDHHLTPTAKTNPALAERLAVLNTDEPMPPAEGPEDVAPGPAQDPTRNPGLVPSPLLRYSAASGTP